MQKNNHFFAVLFLVFSVISAYIASLIERDFGRIDVTTVTFNTEEQQPMVAKLYRPLSASADSPKPALLALHGY